MPALIAHLPRPVPPATSPTTPVFRSIQPQRSGAEERYALGLHFADVAGRERPILLDALGRVAEDDMRDLVEQRSVGHRRQWGHGDLLAPRETPHVTVRVVE